MDAVKAASARRTEGSSLRIRPLTGLVTWAAVPWLVVLAGAGLRLERFVNNRSLWLDEALLALNVIEKSAHALLHSLSYTQSAPSGFLLIEKASVDVFGDGEHALRVFPMLASIGGLVLFALVVRRLLPRWPAMLALTLYAVNEPLLYQSSEAKPYSSDGAVALLIVWLTLRALDGERGPIGVRRILPLLAAGLVAVWISYPSVFVLGGAFVALLVWAGPRFLRASAPAFALLAAAWSASFLVEYAVSRRTITAVSASVFGEGSHTSRLDGLARSGWVALFDPGGFLPSLRSVVVLCIVAGVAAFAVGRRKDRFALLTVPPVLAIVAAFLSKYPLGGRFSIFLVALLLIVVAAGAAELVRASRRPWLLGLPLVALLLAPPLVKAVQHTFSPTKREEVRPILSQLERDWQPGDTLYVYKNAQYALRYYGECRDCGLRPLPFRLVSPPAATEPGFPAALASAPPAVVVGKNSATMTENLRTLASLRGRARVWLLLSHVTSSDEGLFTAYLDTFGRQVGRMLEPGASLYLYDLRS